MDKYNFILDMKNETAISTIAKRIKENSRVLEFGPAHGRLTKYLKEDKNCIIDIVEIDKVAGKDASVFARNSFIGEDEGDIEKCIWSEKLSGQKYDYIIFADVLEHLYDPDKALSTTKKYLNENGEILISIPNICNDAILINMYNNKFSYTETGLLDDTHIRFWGINNFEDFVKKSGYEIGEYKPIYNDIAYTEQAKFYNNNWKETEKLLQGRSFGNVYQFVFILKHDQGNKFKFLENKKFTMNIFYDTGKDFNSEEVISNSCESGVINKYKIKFSGRIKRLRVDPVEGYWSTIKDLSVKINGINIAMNAWNKYSYEIDKNDYFFHEDPIYISDYLFLEESVFDIEIEYFLDVQSIYEYFQLLKCLDEKMIPKINYIEKTREVEEKTREVEEKTREVEEKTREVEEKTRKVEEKTREVEEKTREVEEKAREVEEKAREVEIANNFISIKNMDIRMLEDEIYSIKSSRTWRYGRKLVECSFPYGSMRRSLIKFLLKPIIYFKRIIFNRNKKENISQNITTNDGKCDENLQYDKLLSSPKIVILTTKHCEYIAKSIEKCLLEIGKETEIIFKQPEFGFESVYHIVICPQIFDFLPKQYVAFQMEQSISDRWFTDEYLEKLNNASEVFDYSLTNIEYLQNRGIQFKKLFYMPISYYNFNYKETDLTDKKYDILFYGDPTSDRRSNIINRLSQKYKIKIIRDLFGEELEEEIKNAKIVINIHYYENALLETTRLYQLISLNTSVIISEDSIDVDEHEDLKKYIDFVKCGDVEGIESRIEYWLANQEKIIKKLNENSKIKSSISENKFEFCFYRYLLATGNISFDMFYRLASEKIELKGDKWCLGLVESVKRQSEFKLSNKYGFYTFMGLRHNIGWIGCGLSYKFMLNKAEDYRLNNVTICEDDVLFDENFEKTYNDIKNYLDSISGDEWDIYSGLIADASDEMRIFAVDEFKGKEYIYINKLVSTVFNIYNNSVYKMLAQWDEKDFDVQKNTIDRYIENHSKVKGITTIPYIVGHREEVDSVIWGFNNVQYRDMISISERKIAQKLKEFNKETK